MDKSMQAGGYIVRFRIREQKKRRRVKGRARGFYEGKYVYLRVIGPDQVVRDLYLGTTTRSRSSKPATGGESAGARATSPALQELELEGEKRGVDPANNDGYRFGFVNGLGERVYLHKTKAARFVRRTRVPRSSVK